MYGEVDSSCERQWGGAWPLLEDRAVSPADNLICLKKKWLGAPITVTGLHFGSFWRSDRKVKQDP